MNTKASITPPDPNEGVVAGTFMTSGLQAKDIVMKTSSTLVTLGCAAGVALALVGAAYALDAPMSGDAARLAKGDQIIELVPANSNITVQDVNPHLGISNLVIVPAEPSS